MEINHNKTTTIFSNIIDKNLRFKYLGSTVLKIIAVISMFIDHFGFLAFTNIIILREIGRLALPIFCFLIVIGMSYTSNRKKYLLRLIAYFFILQIPVTIALNFFITGFSDNLNGFVNIFFILSAGAGFIFLYKYKKWISLIYLLLMTLILVINEIPEINSPINIDYSWYGFYLIVGFFFCFEIYKNWKNEYSFLVFKIVLIIFFTAITITWIQIYNMYQIFPNVSKFGTYSFVSDVQIYALWCIPLFLFFTAKKEKQNKLVKYGFYLSYPISFAIPFLVILIINSFN